MNILERFIRYAAVDTQSSEKTADKSPSTPGQRVLAEMLRGELEAMGMTEVEVDEHSYVYATLPANSDEERPVIGFIAHLDTSPDAPGKDVKPQVEDGIVRSDGTTLLGADDKAGIAEIMSAMEELLRHPEVKHGKVRVAFTPDEEIGQGAKWFDVKKFGCEWAYTMDGGEAGELEYENFNAASAKITVKGFNVHPGYAKGKMKNAVRIATELAQTMPDNEVPEKTDGYAGFYHLTGMDGTVEEAHLSYIIRDHNRQMFEMRKHVMRDLAERFNDTYGDGTVLLEINDSYYNMLSELQGKPHITELARKAIEKVCGHCDVKPIRGGTDGAVLSFRGLPCPNIFAGGINFHSRQEYVPVKSMEQARDVIIEIIKNAKK